jgi:histidine triad (HIT) family protein
LKGRNSFKVYPTNKSLKGMNAMSECIFCQIIRKEASASIIYENEEFVAFLSNRPVNEGHTLVVPKKHYENIYEISEEEAAYLFKVVKRVAHAVRDAVGAEGIRIVQNNGWAAGQVVFHLHVHVIPMKPQEGFTHGKAYRDLSQARVVEALEQDAEKIRQHL